MNLIFRELARVIVFFNPPSLNFKHVPHPNDDEQQAKLTLAVSDVSVLEVQPSSMLCICIFVAEMSLLVPGRGKYNV